MAKYLVFLRCWYKWYGEGLWILLVRDLRNSVCTSWWWWPYLLRWLLILSRIKVSPIFKRQWRSRLCCKIWVFCCHGNWVLDCLLLIENIITTIKSYFQILLILSLKLLSSSYLLFFRLWEISMNVTSWTNPFNDFIFALRWGVVDNLINSLVQLSISNVLILSIDSCVPITTYNWGRWLTSGWRLTLSTWVWTNMRELFWFDKVSSFSLIWLLGVVA